MPTFLKNSFGGEGWNKNNLPLSSIIVPNIKKDKTDKTGAKFLPYSRTKIKSKTIEVTSNDPSKLRMENGRSKIRGTIV
jgi:hypothetical protein